jgi:hypothetical protein
MTTLQQSSHVFYEERIQHVFIGNYCKEDLFVHLVPLCNGEVINIYLDGREVGVQTGFGAQQASYSVGTDDSFSWGKASGV